MFAKLSTFVVASTFFLVVASAPAPNNPGDINQCNGASAQCCNSTQDSNSLDASLSALLGLLGIHIDAIDGLVGVTCSPITGVGVGAGSSCTAQPVCCTNDSFNGLVAIGCSPINISL